MCPRKFNHNTNLNQNIMSTGTVNAQAEKQQPLIVGQIQRIKAQQREMMEAAEEIICLTNRVNSYPEQKGREPSVEDKVMEPTTVNELGYVIHDNAVLYEKLKQISQHLNNLV